MLDLNQGQMAMAEPDHTIGGLPRRAFSVAEVERMVEAGLFELDERLELIGGELVRMPPKGLDHETLKTLLVERWIKAKPDRISIMPATTFRLSDYTFLEPDILVVDRARGLAGLKGENALLVVEISDSPVAYDATKKAEIYAYFGVPEFWVINAASKATRIYRRPSGPSKTPPVYAIVREIDSSERLEPLAAPELSVKLNELQI